MNDSKNKGLVNVVLPSLAVQTNKIQTDFSDDIDDCLSLDSKLSERNLLNSPVPAPSLPPLPSIKIKNASRNASNIREIYNLIESPSAHARTGPKKLIDTHDTNINKFYSYHQVNEYGIQYKLKQNSRKRKHYISNSTIRVNNLYSRKNVSNDSNYQHFLPSI